MKKIRKGIDRFLGEMEKYKLWGIAEFIAVFIFMGILYLAILPKFLMVNEFNDRFPQIEEKLTQKINGGMTRLDKKLLVFDKKLLIFKEDLKKLKIEFEKRPKWHK